MPQTIKTPKVTMLARNSRARTWLFVDDSFEETKDETNITAHCDELAKIKCRWVRFVVEVHETTGTRLRGCISFKEGKSKTAVEKLLNMPESCKIMVLGGQSYEHVLNSFEQAHSTNHILMDYENGTRLKQGARTDRTGDQAGAAEEPEEIDESVERMLAPYLARHAIEF